MSALREELASTEKSLKEAQGQLRDSEASLAELKNVHSEVDSQLGESKEQLVHFKGVQVRGFFHK